jgi:C-terminal processing protease CtpA/Prc
MIARFALVAALALDPAFVAAVIQSLGATIKQEYFDPKIAGDVDAALRRSLAAGGYTGATDDRALATLINRDLYAATHDKHLAIEARLDIPAQRERSAQEAAVSRATVVRRSNAGVHRVEILAGNVGYLDLSNFFRPEEARDALATAMRFLAQADALIVDMRENTGGSPGTVALLISYLLEPDVPLWDIVHRAPETPDHYTTEPGPLADRDVKRPVYVLTSLRTFSAGEGFAFILQERRRAEIVGEVTAGAANPGRPYRVNARFSITIPNGQVKSAIGGGNWEGAGVTPDVKTVAADALKVAHARALHSLIEREQPGPWRDALERTVKALEGR